MDIRVKKEGLSSQVLSDVLRSGGGYNVVSTFSSTSASYSDSTEPHFAQQHTNGTIHSTTANDVKETEMQIKPTYGSV